MIGGVSPPSTEFILVPSLSRHLASRAPSAVRRAQERFARRPDRASVNVLNLAIGNVSRPMHPAMIARMQRLGTPSGGFPDGVVKYSMTGGISETQAAFLHILDAFGVDTTGLSVVVTDGGSQAMELMLVALCGPGGERPLLAVDPVYSNYLDLATRIGARVVAVGRPFSDEGLFGPPDLAELEAKIVETKPVGLLICPADNPTGALLRREDLIALAKLCVRHDLWLVSDEAYRGLQFGADRAVSVFHLTEDEVPGITGRRITIESSSKGYCACGLRIGALITDREDLHEKVVYEYTSNLCANVIGQHIFAGLGEVPADELMAWFDMQNAEYAPIMREIVADIRARIPEARVAPPEAALYTVIDLSAAMDDFDAGDFTAWCAGVGKVRIGEEDRTLLLAPLAGFFAGNAAPARGMMRLAFVASDEEMRVAPRLLAELLEGYRASKS